MAPKAVKRLNARTDKSAPKSKATKSNNMADILGAVKALTEKVATLEKKLENDGQKPAITEPEPDITIEDLRQMAPLSSRADAMLQDIGPATPTPSSGKKNPRLSQKRAIVKSIHWPHQFVHRPGASDISFDDVTMAEFVAGTCAVLLLPELPAAEARCRLQHMQYLMHLSRTIPWDRVRNLYAAALEDIQTGQREWHDSLVDLKETLLPVPSTATKATTNTLSSPNPCRKFNYDECKLPNCIYPHACYYCWTTAGEYNVHSAKRCFKRNKASKNGVKKEAPYQQH